MYRLPWLVHRGRQLWSQLLMYRSIGRETAWTQRVSLSSWLIWHVPGVEVNIHLTPTEIAYWELPTAACPIGDEGAVAKACEVTYIPVASFSYPGQVHGNRLIYWPGGSTWVCNMDEPSSTMEFESFELWSSWSMGHIIQTYRIS